MDYKKILEGVVNIINTTEKSDIGFANICTYIGESCPELAESEDERIRKDLIAFVKGSISDKGSEQRKAYISWLEKHREPVEINPTEFDTRLQALIGKFDSLPKEELIGSLSFWLNVVQNDGTYKDEEKQGEQKPADKVESNKKFTPIESALKDLICDVDNSYTIEQVRRFLFEYGYKDKILNAAQEEMLKPAWSEEDEKRVHRISDFIWKNRKGDTDEIYQQEQDVNWLKSFKDKYVPQLKQEWSEEDEAKLKSILFHISDVENKDVIDWLKSLKNRVQPQQEWSEEDENRINRLIAYFEDKESFTAEDDIVYANWLKSLRPQNRWKPSDEQMKALYRAQAELCNTEYNKPICDLIDSLKKLKE